MQVKHLDFLFERGAAVRAHSRATLLDHLRGTAELLRAADAPDDLVLAGLFHSVYATESLDEALLVPTERDVVRELIGSAAEELVFLFCMKDWQTFCASIEDDADIRVTHRLTGMLLPCTPEQLSAIASVTIANALEQSARLPEYYQPEDFRRLLRIAGRARPRLREEVERRALA